MSDAFFARHLLVVTGKGGVGKTTVAIALGLAAARRGLRTIVAEVASRDDVSLALEGGHVDPFHERVLADRLSHVTVDPEHAVREYLHDQLPSRALAETLAHSRMFLYFTAATPGMAELLTIGKVWELAQDVRRTPGGRPYDLVIMDAPATGHGVAMLAAPKTFADAARIGPISRQGRTIHEMLSDPARTGVVAVATAEEMPVNETLTLRGRLHEALGTDLTGIVVNGLLPDRFTAAECEALEAAAPRPATAAALSHHRRARAQRAQLSRLRRGLDGVPVTTLPFLPSPALGPAELGRLSERFA